jgi:diacylglycerol kinase (ATP)
VYPGKLQVSEAYCTVPVNGETTIADLIRESLIRFGLENFRCEDYRLSEILLDRGGTFQCVMVDRLLNCIDMYGAQPHCHLK